MIRLLASVAVVVALVWLDVRALHDIVTREPNLALEYFTIVLSGLAYGGIAGYWVREWRGRHKAGGEDRAPASQATPGTLGTSDTEQRTP